MTRKLELHFRDVLRSARAEVLRDAEAFPAILFAIERTGAALVGHTGGFGKYQLALEELAKRSPLFDCHLFVPHRHIKKRYRRDQLSQVLHALGIAKPLCP